MLTGRRLRSHVSEYRMLADIVENTVAPPSSQRPEVPEALDRIVGRSLERNPAQRFGSVEAMLGELEAFVRRGRIEASRGDLSSLMRRLFGGALDAEEAATRNEKRFEALVSKGMEAAVVTQDLAARVDLPGDICGAGETMDVDTPTKRSARTPPGREATPGSSTPPHHRKRVLIVDDSKTLREVIKVYLVGHDFEYLLAENGRVALNLARTQRLDLVISDVSMPDMDGLQFCAAIRQDPALCRTPVVMVSSRAAVADRQAGLAAGASEYLTKPIDSAELSRVVKKLIG
jgi:CheY-like chemotaxis protein